MRVICWLTGFVLFMLVAAAPLAGLCVRLAADGVGPSQGFGISTRQLALLGRTLLLAAGAATGATVLSLPVAAAVGGVGRLRAHPARLVFLLMPLLLPATVYAFGWNEITGAVTPMGTRWGHARCMLVWCGWCWPVPALMIGASWMRQGRGAFQAALLNTGSWNAFMRAALPAMMPAVVMSWLMVMVLLVGDYAVPHACSLSVTATELLSWAGSSNRLIDVVWAAVPVVVTLAVLLAIVWRMFRSYPVPADSETDGSGVRTTSRWVEWSVIWLPAVSVGLPVAGLIGKLEGVGHIATALETYPTEIVQSLLLAAGTGVVAVVAGLWVVGLKRARPAAIAAAVVLGLLPGALCGLMFVAAYSRFSIIYDSWVLMLLALVGRYLWIAVLVSWMAMRSVSEDYISQARIDGADAFAVTHQIRLPLSWPTLAAGAAVIAALCLSDLATASLVTVPDVGWVSMILVEKFHRFEDQMLVSLCLLMAAASIPGVVLVTLAVRWRNRT